MKETSAASSSTLKRTGSGVKVLLVDDQPARLMTYEAILANLDLEFVKALSGLDALQRLMEQEFALIVLDVSMPGMDGFEAARLIREHPRFERTPIIFVTGVHISEMDRLKGYEVGAIDYISVPIVPEILRSKVAVLVELYQRRAELQLLNRSLEEARELLSLEHQAKLAASEARTRAIFEHPAHLTVVIEPRRNAKGEIVDWLFADANARAVEMLGLGREDLVGKELSQVFPSRFARVAALCEAVLRTGEPAQYETAYGERKFLINLFRIGAGTIIGSGLDITARVQAEDDLRASEERFRGVFYGAGIGMALIEPDCTMRAVNPAFCTILGRKDSELLGVSCVAFTHPDDVELSSQVLLEVLAGTQATATLEKRFVRPDGQLRWVRVNIVRMPPKGSDTEKLLAVVDDVTERRESRRRLEALSGEREQLLEAERAARMEAEIAIRAKDEFLAMLSHELRTPLSNVVSWARVLQRKYAGADDDLRRGLGIIVDNAMTQSQLMSDLLDMSRIVAGKVTLETRAVDLAELASVSVQSHQAAAEAKGLSIELRQDVDVALVLGDGTRLQQVLWNLLSNAIKFTPARAGTPIRVSLGSSGDHYELSVTDPGEGIDRQFLPQLFKPFRQADGSIARRHGGLGLGLAIVKQLVEIHGGQVAVWSAGPGTGSTFTVKLPIYEGDVRSPLALGAEELDAGKPLLGYRILAVEDQPAMLEYVRQLLQDHGADVVAVESGQAALDLLRQTGARHVHALVSDLGLPELDGYRLIRAIRTELNLSEADLPAVAVTAFARDEDRTRSHLHGYQAHLVKPYHASQLVSTLRNLLTRRL
jgi:PAS domain S-box-containing protein